MAQTFNGIGTIYYGKKALDEDGSYVTTKWFVIGFFPLVPLGSARVRPLGSSGIPFLSSSSTFEVLEETHTDFVQMLCVYAYAIFIVAWIGNLMTRKGGSTAAQLVAIGAGIAIPHVLRWFSRRLSAPGRG